MRLLRDCRISKRFILFSLIFYVIWLRIGVTEIGFIGAFVFWIAQYDSFTSFGLAVAAASISACYKRYDYMAPCWSPFVSFIVSGISYYLLNSIWLVLV